MTILEILKGRYPESEYVIVEEVSDSNMRRRSLDYMVVSLWGSRGNAITGIEQKISRTDWLRELKNGAKQELHYSYCDYFYLLTTDEKIAKLEEIPETWGWLNIKGDKVYTMKSAPKNQSVVPVTRQLMCAMLRRADCKKGYVHRDSIGDEIDSAFEKGKEQVQHQLVALNEKYSNMKQQVIEFEQLSGLKLGIDSWRWKSGDSEKIAKAIKFISEGGLEAQKDKIQNMLSSTDEIKNALSVVLESLDV